MASYIGASCPICDRKFVLDDDIVVCPECGTPYHRSCYLKVNHCVNTQLHEKHENWSQDKVTQEQEQRFDAAASLRCSKCGTINPSEGIFCQICGSRLRDGTQKEDNPTQSPQPISLNAFTTPFGGVSPDEEIQGVSVRDIALFVGENSHYFIPLFKAQFSAQRMSAWNWPAFFFRGFYFIYRKMYALGFILLILTALLGIPASICNFAILFQIPAPFGVSFTVFNRLRIVCSVASVGLSLFSAVWVNRIYCRQVFHTIRRIQNGFRGDSYSQDYILALTKKGRTNRIAIAIVLLLIFMASMFLSLFLAIFVV